MNNEETADAIVAWAAKPRMPFSWPTDTCGYEQHMRFVKHRNENFDKSDLDFREFALQYAEALRRERK